MRALSIEDDSLLGKIGSLAMKRKIRMLGAMTVIASAVVFGVAATGEAEADTGAWCLWAGGAHAPGETITAGGWRFTCGSDFGGARWYRGQRTGERSDVPNPGTGNIVGRFSPGAQQPGTDYNDYCVGNQLIEGAEAVYEATTDGRTQWWKASAMISQWTFSLGDHRPGPTWRSSSMCYDGALS